MEILTTKAPRHQNFLDAELIVKREGFGGRRLMKESVIVFTLVVLVCLGLTSVYQHEGCYEFIGRRWSKNPCIPATIGAKPSPNRAIVRLIRTVSRSCKNHRIHLTTFPREHGAAVNFRTRKHIVIVKAGNNNHFFCNLADFLAWFRVMVIGCFLIEG